MATLSALQQFGFSWTPAAKATWLQELAGCFSHRLSPDAQNRAFAENGSCIQILDTTLAISSIPLEIRNSMTSITLIGFFFWNSPRLINNLWKWTTSLHQNGVKLLKQKIPVYSTRFQPCPHGTWSCCYIRSINSNLQLF